MKPIAGEILIGAQVEAVFDFVADESNEPLYNRRMLRSEKLTAGAVGPEPFLTPGRGPPEHETGAKDVS